MKSITKKVLILGLAFNFANAAFAMTGDNCGTALTPAHPPIKGGTSCSCVSNKKDMVVQKLWHSVNSNGTQGVCGHNWD